MADVCLKIPVIGEVDGMDKGSHSHMVWRESEGLISTYNYINIRHDQSCW